MSAGKRLASGRRSTSAVALLALLVVSCSSTSDPSLTVSNSEAGAPVVDLAVARADETAQAALPETKPDQKTASREAPAEPTGNEEKKTAEASPADEAKPEPAKTVAATPESSPTGQVLEHGGPILTAGTMPEAPAEPKKKSLLASFFGTTPAQANPARANPLQADPTAAKPRESKEKPVITLPDARAEKNKKDTGVRVAALNPREDRGGDFTLPGVRTTDLFEIKRKSGLDDDSDIDIYENEGGGYQVASAAGLARLAPNGLLKQRESVDTACLKPKLVRMLKQVERHFGKRLVITSGYRSPSYNKKVRGALKSQHMYCAAADVQMAGVNKWELARYVRSLPGRGGVGTYCHQSVHIDIGPERDWNWKCGGRKS